MSTRSAERARLVLTIARQVRNVKPRHLNLAVRECLDGTWQGRVFDRYGFDLAKLVASIRRELAELSR